MKLPLRCVLACLLLGVLGAAGAGAVPLGSGFTYQGKLDQSGSPVNGTAHFRFSLWDALAGGTQVGASQIVSNVLVTGGIFTVELNGSGQFSSGAFNGDARWLQIEVCTGPTCTSSTTLTPRQTLTGTPYALESVQSKTLLNLDGGVMAELYPASITNAPGIFAGRLHHSMLLGNFQIGGGASHGFLSIGYAGGASRRLSFGRASSSDFNTAVFEHVLTMNSSNGFVGIGTAAPTEKLQVEGRVMIEGDLAAAGPENLRIIRGTIFGNGNVQYGSGFTVANDTPAPGRFTITFNTPFSSPPSVVATPNTCSGCFVTISQVESVSTTQVVLSAVYRHDGSYASSAGPVHFIATGPR